MAKFVESKSLGNMAKKLIAVRDEVSHVDVNEVLFFSELETMGKAAAKCFNLYNHPAQFFTEARFAIVFYESMIDYFTPDQRAILLLHEMKHIPATGNKLIDHDIKDFYDVLKLGIDWNMPGAIVPKLIEYEDEEKEK